MILTRFPPEPNGYLHIGHAKAMRFSFTLASDYQGKTYLRFDDTNPEKENQEFIDTIQDSIRWLGFKPWKKTHASEYFQVIFEKAQLLIQKGKAYVCEQNQQQISEFREKGIPSPHRNRSVEENLRLFLNMSKGLYDEG